MFWYSTALHGAAKNLSNAKKLLRYLYSQDETKQDIEAAKTKQDEKIRKLREVQQNDRQFRDEMLEEQAKQKAKPRNTTAISALKVLQEAEKYT